MDPNSIAKTLTAMGVGPQDAAQLQKRMDGRDLTNLVNALNFPNSSQGRSQVQMILRKYGIEINKVKEMSDQPVEDAFAKKLKKMDLEQLTALYRQLKAQAEVVRQQGGTIMSMSQSKRYKEINRKKGLVHMAMGSKRRTDDRLSEMYAAFKEGKTPTELLDHLIPIAESKDPIAHLMALEGYNYETQVENATVGTKLIDWLEENLVDYQTNGAGQFQIKCPDRDHAYRVSSAISRIMRGAGRATMYDSANPVEESMSKKKAPTVVPTIKPQNVMKTAGRMASGAGSHNSSNPDRKDSFSRKAKHKGARFEEIEYSLGETVMVGDREATIKIPHGPNGTVGVVMDGELTMLSRNEINLTEGVMGMTGVNPLFRLRELAGLPAQDLADAPKPGEMSPLSDVEGDTVAPAGDIEMDTDFDNEPSTSANLGMDGDMAAVDGIDGEMDMPMDDLGGDMAPSLAPQMGGVPGDLPPVMDTVPVAPVQSEAYASIEDSLNQVQSMLGDVKLSEYRTLVKKLEDLANQVRNMGRDYLGEHAHLRAKKK